MPWRPKTLLSTQLMTPYLVSNSHCQTVMVASTGVPQASSIATCMVMRAPRAARVISTAKATPMSIVSAALTRQNAIDRAMTVHTYESVSSSV